MTARLTGIFLITTGVLGGIFGLMLTFGYLLEHHGTPIAYSLLILLTWTGALALVITGARLRK